MESQDTNHFSKNKRIKMWNYRLWMKLISLPLFLKKETQKKQKRDRINLTKCSFPEQETACEDIVVSPCKSCHLKLCENRVV